ncbi:diphthine--ammonia ligase [Halobacillus sp. BBL2006]|uniref:Dph6-related ATP pyrophosphatase n=1 Tax=Halobacillus sp. BBL2006 TaxID=1543706 RepID=UPI00068F5DD2|nr:diphthine--ammonia ligase [Halobacillus sp. BBL2006]
MKPVIVSWSGGKDSALALKKVMEDKQVDVKGLFSTISEQSSRLPIHEVGGKWIQQQAESIGLPLFLIEMQDLATNEQYEGKLRDQFEQWKQDGIYTIVYADLFLEDIKKYRDQMLSRYQMEGYYPLWETDTEKAANNFISKGFQAIVTTVDTEKVPEKLVGHHYNQEFLKQLPAYVDPCGENGEFHTYVYNGPNFKRSIPVKGSHSFYTMDGRFAHIDLV